jgi:hypothetical protein
MWPPLLEKAWAKIIGNYIQADGGITINSLHALTGAPVFTYLVNSNLNFTIAFQLIKISND